MTLYYPSSSKHLALLPISSMQWSSVVVSRNATRLGFIDVEQANALSLLLSRAYWNERPIFSYVEFMIRAAESFFDDGDLPLAISVSERANERLAQYSRSTADGTHIPRPQAMRFELVDILESNLLLSFITGHEIGHLLQMADNAGVEDLFQWVADRFKEEQIDISSQPKRMRFVFPEVLQKFNEDGESFGFAVQGVKLAKTVHRTLADQTREAQSDALGVLLATEVAQQINVPADVLLTILMSTLEHTELLMSLKRLLPQLPRGELKAAVSDRSTGLVARQMMLLRFCLALKSGEVCAPQVCLDYWSELSEEVLARWTTLRDTGLLEQIGLRPSVVARGGVELGLQKTLQHPVEEEELILQLGFAAGGQMLAQAHRQFPQQMFRIEDSFKSANNIDPVLRAWGGAIRDLAELTSTETRPQDSIRSRDIAAGDRRAAFVELLRSSRTQVVAREINESWASGFESHLRANLA
ncbi:MAG: hypothetical protein LAT81_03400 [Oceanicaulis sp.]|nr:hypothetical protein [Oceanicaulis sp.]